MNSEQLDRSEIIQRTGTHNGLGGLARVAYVPLCAALSSPYTYRNKSDDGYR
jgi:hypothetical protein